jgi:nucleosome binding factor SPN SPT16 subunit
VKITSERGVCLTEGIKQSKDVVFFLNAEEEKKSSKAPVRKDIKTGSPVKHKMAGNKVLRNKTRSSAQEEADNSAAVKLANHQRELHEARQREGLAKYSEEGKGGAGKEGKSWKRFQSYKSESALPPEVQSLRVSDVL